MKHYVIIGGGVAALHCIEGIRSLDREGPVTLLCAEEESNYGRPLISYYLQGKTDRARMTYRDGDFYEKNGVTARHGVTAEAIDPEAGIVTLEGGEAISYDELCVAAGSSPFVPPFEGLDTVERRFTFMTLVDARALEAAVTPGSRVLIVGGGLIGLKCAEGLHGRAGSVAVCDLASHVLSSILQEDSALVVEKHLKEQGLELMLGDSVRVFQGNHAVMLSGAELDFDVLVLAIGVRPNSTLVRDAGGETARGIVTGPDMRTSLPHVWAAGDCAESVNSVSGGHGVLAILPNAAVQGRVAGENMAGGSARYEGGFPMNSMGLFGLHLMTAGSYYGPEDGGAAYEEPGEGHKKLFTRDGVLTGFILIGDVHRAGIYTALIRDRTKLDTLDFDAVRRDPSLLPFGRAYRAKKLGGMV